MDVPLTSLPDWATVALGAGQVGSVDASARLDLHSPFGVFTLLHELAAPARQILGSDQLFAWYCSSGGGPGRPGRRLRTRIDSCLVRAWARGHELPVDGPGDGQGHGVGEGLAVVAASPVGFGGHVVFAGLDAVTGAFEVRGPVLQLDDDAEGTVAAQLVVVNGEAAPRDAAELEVQVWFEVAARDGDDVEAGDGSHVHGLVVAVLADRLHGGQGVAQRDRRVGAA